MMDVKLWSKLGVAFAAGVSLSAGYVAIGHSWSAPAIVVVQERCPEAVDTASPAAVELPRSWRIAPNRGGAIALREGAVNLALQREGLFLGDERVLQTNGVELDPSAVERHIIAALDTRMQGVKLGLRHASLYIDPDARMRDLVDVVYTLGRNGVLSYQLVVSEATQAAGAGLWFGPPMFTDGVGDSRTNEAQLIVELQSEGLRVGRRLEADPKTIEWGPVLAWDDDPMVELERIARELALELRKPAVALFRADPQLPVSRLLEAMSAASGSDCTAAAVGTADPRHCHFVQRILEAG
jgi:hypothetical protein